MKSLKQTVFIECGKKFSRFIRSFSHDFRSHSVFIYLHPIPDPVKVRKQTTKRKYVSLMVGIGK